MEASLDAGHARVAARTVLAAVAQGSTFPDGLPLDHWLPELDAERRARLVAAFAHYPCFACRNGQEHCDACGGSGYSAPAQVCRACVGFGEKRCDFCAGAGLATYSVMPVELWSAVIAERAGRAVKYLEKLASHPRCVTAPLTEAAAARRIQDLNKLLGVLENAFVAVRELSASGVVTSRSASHFADTCARSSGVAVAAMRDALRRLATHFDRLAQTVSPVKAANAEAKAEFYEELSISTMFDGTGLAHPFLPIDTDLAEEAREPA